MEYDNLAKQRNSNQVIKRMWYYLITMLLVSGYVEFRPIWHLMLIVLTFFVAAIFKGTTSKIWGRAQVVLLITLLLGLATVSAVAGENYSNLVSNIRSMLYSLTAIFILLLLFEKNEIYLLKLYDKGFYLFNITLVINTSVLAIQSKGTGFMIKPSWLEINPYYDDQCAGLFGFNATNVLGLFAIFVIVYNIIHFLCWDIKKRRKNAFLLIYTVIIAIIQAYLSKYNDNMGYYILLVMFVCVLFLFDLVFIQRKAPKILFKIIICIVIGLISLYLLSRTTFYSQFVNRVLKNRVEVMLRFSSVEMTGSNERLHILLNALSNKWGWFVGTGLGTAPFFSNGYLGFRHFGLSSVGSYVTLLGIWFYLLYTFLYTLIIYRIIMADKRKNKGILLIIYLIMVVFSFYTSIFNDARSVILLGLIALAFRTLSNKYIKAHNSSNNRIC